jgi:hypothetical protein
MIKSITFKNVSPMPDGTIDFGKRLNVITGDNGLGKSFLLDIIWFALTNRWPIEVNGRMTSGNMAHPMDVTKEASIEFVVGKMNGDPAKNPIKAKYERQNEFWRTNRSTAHVLNLVLYAHYDGSFSVWDPYRNYWTRNPPSELFERQPAFVFTPSEVWDGTNMVNKMTGKEVPICNGLIRDLVSWQDGSRKGDPHDPFSILEKSLELLSPPDFSQKLTSAEHKRISTSDSREYPFIRMPYGEIPVVLASAGIRRVLSLAYMLTWTLTEHWKSSIVLGMAPATQMTFLFDEVDAHLHPKWQRQIMDGIMNVLQSFSNMAQGYLPKQKSLLGPSAINTQIISVTHSPLVMASLEGLFDRDYDKWLDLDLSMKDGSVQVTERDFIKMGDAEGWLTSEAFDLKSTYSVQAEKAMNEYNELMANPPIDEKKRKAKIKELEKLLPDTDPFWYAVDFPEK